MSGDVVWAEDTTLPDAPLIVDTGCPSEIAACWFAELIVLGIAETETDRAP